MRFRLKKLVKHGLQLKMISVFIGLACISGCFQLILVNRSLVQLVRDSKLVDTGLADRLPAILTNNFLWTLAVLVPLMGWVGLLMTQRIAGPVYRFEKYLDSFAAGEDLPPCKIRKGDELQELCDRLNKALDRARVLQATGQGSALEAKAEAEAEEASESSEEVAA